MEVSTNAHEKINRIDRGLGSIHFHDQVEILAQTITFVEENPFPYFVNTVMVRLAKAFRAERSIYGNQFRLRIIKLVEECRPYLNVVFSRDQIVQEIVYVSHSTDYKARSLVLMFLGALAPIVYDNKRVHHLLLESLESSQQLEVVAAISASGNMAIEFASAVVEKISGMVLSTQTDYMTKLRVINMMANFKENFEVTKKCMALSNKLLHENFDVSLTVAILMAMTSLAYRSSLGVSEQISLLFSQLYKAVPNRALTRSILRCLSRLAHMPHHWSPTHISQLLDFMERIKEISNPNVVILTWLTCLEILTLTGIHSIAINERLASCWSLMEDPTLAIRISAIRIFMNILVKLPSEQLHIIMMEAIINTCVELRTTNQEVDKRKFYKLLTEYLKTGSCPESGTTKIMTHLLKTTHTDADFQIIVESLNAICDSDPEACPIVSQWAHSVLKDADFSKSPPSMALVSLFLLPVELNEILFDRVVDYVDDFTIYRIARTAFRNGHWKLVAEPLLESINEKAESRETKNWMSALANLAHSQIRTPDVESFSDAYNSLNEAAMILGKFESIDLTTQNFNFCHSYVQCLQATYTATMKILEMLNYQSFYLVAQPDTPNVQKTISNLCSDLSKTIEEMCIPRWQKLYSRSFDADPQTLFHMQLWVLYIQNLISLMQYFSKESTSHISAAINTDLNTPNRQFQALVFWMKAQVDKLWENPHKEVHKRVTENAMNTLETLMKKFWTSPIYMPRYFFQNLHKTVFRLNLLPQPKDKEGTVTITSKRLPVTVEGMIQTNNPNRIETIQVNLVASSLKEPSKQMTYQREIELQEDENYFKAQFLLTLQKSTKISVNLTFVDANTKKTWDCETTGQLIVMANE